ncbi:MAG: GNAT family N-acetyltransferase [Firmicutes bacterium]|nr:GNAT family N-acetyltransferase [Bacillota bacterium]
MKTQLLTSIGEISLKQWAQVRSGSFYTTTEWLTHVEGSLGQERFYVTVWDDTESCLLGAAPFYLFERSTFAPYNLSTLLPPGMHDGPTVPNVICTAPHGYCCALSMNPALAPEEGLAARELLLSVAEAEARRRSAIAHAFLYVEENGQGALIDSLRSRGYRTFPLDAKNLLSVTWSSFEDYLASLSRHRRVNARCEIRRFQSSGCSIAVEGAEALNERLALLEANVHHKYGLKTSVDRVRRIHLRAQKYLAPFIRVFVARRENVEIGFAQFYVHDGTYYAGFVGFDYDLSVKSFSYFNTLFYAPIQDAIAHGALLIDYGLGADAAKVARGCQAGRQIGLFKDLA